MRGQRIAASLAVATMIVGLSARGGGDDSLEGLSAPEVMERVQEDMETVSSLRISGEAEGGGATRDLDLALDDDGNYEGTFSIDEVAADILIVDDRLFVRGGERFWTETGLVADSQMAGSFAGQCEGETTEIDGTLALELIAEDDRGTTRMWVSTGQDNHVLKLAREGAEPEEFTRGDYNEPVDVSVPDENEILDLTPTGS